MNNILYGDGLHDDRPAIQELLDSGVRTVVLPEPKKRYMISSTLFIPSNVELKMGRFTEIRLRPLANCPMIQNSDCINGNVNICVDGGIWDMNHSVQQPNPLHFKNSMGKTYHDYVRETGFDPKTAKCFPDIYFGTAIRFCGVKNLIFKNATVKNPVTYGIQVAYLEQFTFENIIFDYTEGSPKLWNMDGLHLDGYCKYGVIRNLQGACHDDLVALVAEDSVYGPLENILIDGIFSENGHSAVRLLSHSNLIKNIRITNVYGRFYVYCVGITNYSNSMSENDRGHYENIVIDNVFTNLCEGTTDVKGGNFSPITIDYNLHIRNLRIQGFYRDEKVFNNATISVGKGTVIDQLILSDIRQTNATEKDMPLIQNEGKIEHMVLESFDIGEDRLVVGEPIMSTHTRE